jgi:hypothetical protein
MPVRNVALLLCGLLHVGLCQNPAGILVEGIGERGPDFMCSASELALLPQRTIEIQSRLPCAALAWRLDSL